MKLLVTPRLLMRPFATSDLDDLTALFADPAVMQYIGPTALLAPAKAADRLHEMMDDFQADGYGMLAVIERREKRFIGRCGLMKRDGTDDIELDLLLCQNAWGKGYATEAAKEVLRYAFTVLQLPSIVAVTHPNNLASRRVLQKLGMKHIGEGEYYGNHCLRYELGNTNAKPFAYTSKLTAFAYL